MIPTEVHRARRNALAAAVPGPILLLGNGLRARNLQTNHLPFRQDSTFLYFTGCVNPGAAALIDGDKATLFLPEPAEDDAIWHGEGPTPGDIGAALGFDAVEGASTLLNRVPRDAKTLAVPDEDRNAFATQLTGVPLRFGEAFGDPALAQAVVQLRRAKDAHELSEMRAAAGISRQAHEAVMKATRPGTTEARLTALFQAVIASFGATEAYDTILTQRGEVLHNHAHTETIEAGRLLLLDGGAERPSGYASDVTRTWPTSGHFDPRQRAAYLAVLEAQTAAIAQCRVGTPYRDVHLTAARVLARFLRDERLLKIDPDEAVEIGAHALFFPHGVGHLIGLDVHDLKQFGDLGAYPAGVGRSTQFGLSYLRLNLPLERDWVVTVEPGFYVVPAILRDAALVTRFKHAVDFDVAQRWVGFGGIRIEDDIRVTDDAPENLSAAIPKSIAELEALVGRGPTAEDRLW
jgi:Xaa-Pro aminopeptidase